MIVVYFPLKSLSQIEQSMVLKSEFPDAKLSSGGAGFKANGIKAMSISGPYPEGEWRGVKGKMLLSQFVENDWKDHQAHLIISAPFTDDLRQRMGVMGMVGHLAKELGVSMYLMSTPKTTLTFVATNLSMEMPLLSTSGVEVSKTEGKYQIYLQGSGILVGQDLGVLVPSIDDAGKALVYLSSIIQYMVNTGERFVDGQEVPAEGNQGTRKAVLYINERTGGEVIVLT